jgi:hypothetical protein
MSISYPTTDTSQQERSASGKRTLPLPPASFVPASDAEVYQHYFRFIVALVIKNGIEQENAEDVAMTVLTTFIEKGVLADFDPDRIIEYNGVIRKAVFRTFLSGFVQTYTMQHRKKQAKSRYREPFSGDQNSPGVEQSWFDRYGESVSDVAEQDPVDGDVMIQRIRAHLATIKPRHRQDHCNLLDLFDALLRQYDEHGRYSPKLISEEFGVSKNTAVARIARLKPIVSAFMECK